MRLGRVPYRSSTPGSSSDAFASVLYTVEDDVTGFRVSLTDLGAAIVSVELPGRDGRVSGVAFGHGSAEEALKMGSYLGSTIGRVAGRIAEGQFTIDGVEHTLSRNDSGRHTLHGGDEGFDRRFWKTKRYSVSKRYSETVVVFGLRSEDGDQGFPGNLDLEVEYTVRPMEISWEYRAKTDAPTVVNMTNHAYWNLDGHDNLIDKTELRLNASYYLPADTYHIPTGEVRPVAGTPLDLHTASSFERVFSLYGDVDNCFLLDALRDEKTSGSLVHAAELTSPNTGRRMEVLTTEPCIVLYTGNYMDRVTSFGKPCRKHSAVCLEAQKPPNAINLPRFRDSVILRPDQEYTQRTMHKFSVN